MRKSIASRFFSATSTLVVVSISILGFILMYFANSYFGAEQIKSLSNCVEVTVKTLNYYVDISTPMQSTLWHDLNTIADSTQTSISILDVNGENIISSDDINYYFESHYDNKTIKERLIGDADNTEISCKSINNFNTTTDYGVRFALYNNDGLFIGSILAVSKSSSIIMFTNALTSLFIASAGIMLFITSVVSGVMTSNLTTPLRNISDTAKKFSQGDFSSRVVVEGDDEIAKLAITFNQMASFVENNESSRSSFVANIAHELRTPMTSIKGFIDGILDGTIPKDSQAKYLNVVSDEIGRLARLTNSMLDLSKLESGAFTLNKKNYNIWDTLTSVTFALENKLSEKNIEITGFKPRNIKVFADEDIIHQVVYNIFDNALKFTPDNGEITFTVNEDKANSMVSVGIRNYGTGISKEELPYIFDRFYKTDKSRSVHTKGAGIGLFLAKTLVQRSGGEIYVESEDGEYTEFIFTLPLAVKGEKNKK